MRWAGALGVAFAVAGCLLPQDDHLLSPFPTAKNSPPRILFDNVEPTQFTSIQLGCLTAEFKASVADPDIGDSIRVRCFVDQGNRANKATLSFSEGSPDRVPVSVSGKTIRDAMATCRLPLSLGTGLGLPGQHFVEMMIADGELSGDLTLARAFPNPDGGPAIEDSSYADFFTWVVQSTNEPCSTEGAE